MLRSLLIGMVVLALGGFGVIAWIAMNPTPPPAATEAAAPPPPPPKVRLITAARALRAGALLAPDDIATTEVEASQVPVGAPLPTRDALVGGMIRHSLPVGAPVQGEDVLLPHDRGFLAAVLAPGMRAISVGVDAVSGTAGLIWPGDRIDLVLTQSIDEAGQPAARRISGETVLEGLRVIAIDQQLMQGAVAGDGAERNVRTVTLEVTPPQAEQVAVASRLGKLSLVVHAAEPGVPAADPPPVTWAGDVSTALRGDKGTDVLKIYRGPDKAEEVHF